MSLTPDGCLAIDAPDVCATTITTNDIARLAPDGRRFRIIGRKDNVICSGGIKIQAEEVERMLAPHIGSPFIVASRYAAFQPPPRASRQGKRPRDWPRKAAEQPIRRWPPPAVPTPVYKRLGTAGGILPTCYNI